MSTKIDKYFPGVIAFILFTISILSCGDESRTLDKNTRQLVETLARSKVISMDSTIKIECDRIYQTWYEKTVDSLYKIRRYEIENIRNSSIDQDPLGG